MENVTKRELLNSTKVELQRLVKSKYRDDDNLLKIPFDNLYDRKKEELLKNIERKNIEIETLKQKLNDIELDKFEIKKEVKIINIVPPPIAEVKKKEKPKFIKFQKNNFNPNYSYDLKFFNSINDSVPEYILTNLKSMPNNKGYIWRKCWLLGSLKSEKNQPLILFEKTRNIMYIHEYKPNEYKLFAKEGRNQKYLVKHEMRFKNKKVPVPIAADS